MDPAAKSAAISALVQQLRQNLITKDQMFEKLTRLHRGEMVDITPPPQQTTAVPVGGGQQQQPHTRAHQHFPGNSSAASTAAAGTAPVSSYASAAPPLQHPSSHGASAPPDEIGLPESPSPAAPPHLGGTPALAHAPAAAPAPGPALAPGSGGQSSGRDAIIKRLLEQSRQQTRPSSSASAPTPQPVSAGPTPVPHAGGDYRSSSATIPAPVHAMAPEPPRETHPSYTHSPQTHTHGSFTGTPGGDPGTQAAVPISIEEFLSARTGGAAPTPVQAQYSPARATAQRVPPPPVAGGGPVGGGGGGSVSRGSTPRILRKGEGGGGGARRSVSAPRGSSMTPRPTSSMSRGLDDSRYSYWEDSSIRRDTPPTEEEECTFHPQTRPLPSSYGNAMKLLEATPFEVRVQQWQRHKDEEVRRRREKEEAKEFDGCTFHPKINPKSRRTASVSRPDAHLPVSERLYNHSSSQVHRSMSVPRGRPNLTSYETKEEEELRTECTFRPKINRSRNATPVRSRYKNHTQSSRGAASASKPTTLPSGMAECSFRPKVNEVPRDMTAAQVYLQSGIFDRLSRTRGGKIANVAAQSQPSITDGESYEDEPYFDDEAGRSVLDMPSFLRSASGARGGGGGAGGGSSRSVGGTPRARSVSRSRGRPGTDDDASSVGSRRTSAEDREKRFKEFLGRQEQALKRKERKLEETRKQLEQPHTPMVDENSKKIVKATQSGTFLQRVAKDSLKKEHISLQKKAASARDPECTFKPKINPRSKTMKPRSAAELSRGDQLKRETAQRLMRLKAEQAQLDGLTFQPTIKDTGVEGRLRLLADPDSYLERVQREQKLFSDRQRRATQEAEMQEFAECTFRPEIHDAPAYVKRIARSLALTKATKPQTQAPSRPEWR